MKKKIKIKLRYLTEEQYKEWRKENCESECESIEDCIFTCVNCAPSLSACWIYHKEMYSDKFLDQEVEIEVEVKKPQLTDDEKAILRNIDKEWTYIVRDGDDSTLWLHQDKPSKGKFLTWQSYIYFKFSVFNHLFQFIEWEDEEPYLIEDLLKEN